MPEPPAHTRFQPTFRITHDYVGISAERPVRSHRMRLGQSDAMDPHDHDYFELSVVHAGRAVHRCAYYTRPVEAGTVIVVAPGPSHQFLDIDGLEVSNVYYLAEWLLDDLRLLRTEEGLVPLFLAAALFGHAEEALVHQFALDEAELRLCAEEVAQIEAQGREPDPSLLLLKASLQKLMVYVSRAYRRSPQFVGAPAFRAEVWWLLDRVERSITQGVPFQAGEAAAEYGRSADHLSRVFKAATGQTLMAYYQHRRLQHAQRLLLDARNSVTDVAYQVGYSDAAHLCKQFKDRLGQSPGAYRRLYTGRRSG